MISINHYTLIKAGIYIVIFLNIFWMQHKKNIFDIHEKITLMNFIKIICLALLLGVLNATIYVFRYLYLENELFSPVLMICQIISSYGFEILLITSWLRCFYMSGQLYLGYGCILLWVISHFVLDMSVFLLFMFITIGCLLLLRKYSKNKIRNT